MKEIYYRMYQSVFRLISYLLPWKEPIVYSGEEATHQLIDHLVKRSNRRVLFVCDPTIIKLQLHQPLLKQLNDKGFHIEVFDRLQPNPTLASIEDGANTFQQENCDMMIAMGGGSAIDCAKGIGVKIARPKTTFSNMKGVIKVLKKIPYLVAIPTTAGTGSEATIATVVTDEVTHEKYAISDPVLLPKVAVLNPQYTVSLPPFFTATTALDALTHAIEAYIGRSNTQKTKEEAILAIQLIFEYLPVILEHPNDLKAREQLQIAAYKAGRAFTRAYVGYIHAIAHTLGGQYSVPHGLANAIVMPVVLSYYGDSIVQPCADIARAVFKGTANQSDETLSQQLIRHIQYLNQLADIPSTVVQLHCEDIDLLASRALKEANPLYPVPKILHLSDLQNIYSSLLVK